MNTENHIDEYIRKEKDLKPNPFLSTRIMEQIEQLQGSIGSPEPVQTVSQPFWFSKKILPEYQQHSWWQTAAIAASFILIIAAGIGAGSLYTVDQKGATALNINDNQIENRIFINSLAYE